MPLSRWTMLVALLVGLGCLQVSQHNALFMKGYAVGERMGRVHTQETDVSWLQARVIGLTSPSHLARVSQERQLKLVARSTLSPAPASADDAALLGAFGRALGGLAQPLVHLASAPDAPSPVDDQPVIKESVDDSSD